MKVYVGAALDGRSDFLVAATSWEDAAKRLRSAVGYLKRHGRVLETGTTEFKVAMLARGVVWTRKSSEWAAKWVVKDGTHGLPPVRVLWVVGEERGEWVFDRAEWVQMGDDERKTRCDTLLVAEMRRLSGARYYSTEAG